MNVLLEDKKLLEIFSKAFAGKTIKIVAPASGISSEKLKALQELKYLNLGFKIDIPDDILYQDTHENKIPYHANSDEKRFEQLKVALLEQSENTIIWALRGGYGCARLFDELKKLPIPDPKYKKIVIGFSDITALHLFLSQTWGWTCIHGSGFSQLLDAKQDPQNFLKIAEMILRIEEQEDKLISKNNNNNNILNYSALFDDIKPMNDLASSDLLHGLLTGGNLTLLENSIGTHWQIQTAGKVLLLEEVGEKGYRVDRSLYHLYQAGLFHDVKAIILGQFSAPENNTPEEKVIDIALQRFANEMSIKMQIPVYKTNQFGHGDVNYPWVYS